MARKILIGLITIFVCVVGLTHDIDCCRYTGEMRGCYRFMGIPIPFTYSHRDGFRPWLENEIGVKLPQEYVDYVNYPDLIVVVDAAPPGNYFALLKLKFVYDQSPSSRAEVSKLLREVSSQHPPLFDRHQWEEANRLQKIYR